MPLSFSSFSGLGSSAELAPGVLATGARFAIHLTVPVVLVVVALEMAFAVDRGITRNWGAPVRFVYVVIMMSMILYGVVSGVQVLRTFAGHDVNPSFYRGYLLTFLSLTLVLAGAAWLQEAESIPFQRSGAVVFGAFSLWLGVVQPQWFQAHAGVQFLHHVIGEVGTRLLYITIGLVFLSGGILGVPAGLLR